MLLHGFGRTVGRPTAIDSARRDRRHGRLLDHRHWRWPRRIYAGRLVPRLRLCPPVATMFVRRRRRISSGRNRFACEKQNNLVLTKMHWHGTRMAAAISTPRTGSPRHPVNTYRSIDSVMLMKAIEIRGV